jgi:flagellar biosynthesis/type III secretory pathway protein FliH
MNNDDSSNPNATGVSRRTLTLTAGVAALGVALGMRSNAYAQGKGEGKIEGKGEGKAEGKGEGKGEGRGEGREKARKAAWRGRPAASGSTSIARVQRLWTSNVQRMSQCARAPT